MGRRATTANYHCKHCGKTVKRQSDKAWIKSYCGNTHQDVHLTRVKTDDAK